MSMRSWPSLPRQWDSLPGLEPLGFRYLIEFVQSIAYGERGNLLEVLHLTPWYGRFWMPAIGGFLVGSIIYFLARDAKGIGIAEVMEAVALRKGVIKKKVPRRRSPYLGDLYRDRRVCRGHSSDRVHRVLARLNHGPDPQNFRRPDQDSGRLRCRGGDCRNVQRPYWRLYVCPGGHSG